MKWSVNRTTTRNKLDIVSIVVTQLTVVRTYLRFWFKWVWKSPRGKKIWKFVFERMNELPNVAIYAWTWEVHSSQHQPNCHTTRLSSSTSCATAVRARVCVCSHILRLGFTVKRQHLFIIVLSCVLSLSQFWHGS